MEILFILAFAFLAIIVPLLARAVASLEDIVRLLAEQRPARVSAPPTPRVHANDAF